MIRYVSLVVLLLSACSSSSSSTSSSGGGACPNVAGTWKVTSHCDASLVGQNAVITQTDCSLTFAPPFNGFTGSVSADGKINLGGPQSCTGTNSASTVTMACSPGTCSVTLGR